MIRTFGELAAAFNKWKSETGKNITNADSFGYIWQIGQPAKEIWRTEFEEKVDDATEDEINSFHSMFEEGGKLLGIAVSKASSFRGIKLYKVAEYESTFTIPEVLFSYDDKIIDISDTITLNGDNVALQAAIKPQSIVMTNTFDGRDTFLSPGRGIIYGYGYSIYQRDTNRQGDHSIIATVDYKTGNIHLLHSSLKNEQLVLDYEDFCVNILPTLPTGGSSGSGDASSISAAADASDEGEEAEVPEFDKLDCIDITGTLTYFGDPCTEVFSFDLDK